MKLIRMYVPFFFIIRILDLFVYVSQLMNAPIFVCYEVM